MKIDLTSGWTVADYGEETIRQTSGSLCIWLGGQATSLVVDARSNTTRDTIRVALYPLALWIASSWWRLRWEPAPSDKILPATSWRMAHEMAAAGYGYTWPNISFRSDGETIEATSTASEAGNLASVRYLLNTSELMSGSAFEQVIDGFLDLALSRLDNVGIHHTDLHALWADVLAERRDPEATQYRRIEAELGYDPAEAPSEIMEYLLSSARLIGENAISEIAVACAGPNPGRKFSDIEEAAKQEGISATAAHIVPLSQTVPLMDTCQVSYDYERQAKRAVGSLMNNSGCLANHAKQAS